MLSTSLLGALRCFEVAARHCNFTHAAAEMQLTTAAVSHQVRALERRLERILFIRLPRGLALTDDGQTLLATVAPVFASIDSAVQRLTQADAPLRVSCSPSFSMLWLMPRLGEVYAQWPGIKLQLRAEFQDVGAAKLAADGIDIAIRYRPANPAESDRLLMPEYLAAVVRADSPLAARPSPWPSDTRLLHDAWAWEGAQAQAEWQAWFDASQIPPNPAWQAQEFSLFWLALNAAQHGQGICLGRLGLVLGDLESGALTLANPVITPSPAQYWLAVRPNASAQIVAFAQWLQSRCADYHHAMSRYASQPR